MEWAKTASSNVKDKNHSDAFLGQVTSGICETNWKIETNLEEFNNETLDNLRIFRNHLLSHINQQFRAAKSYISWSIWRGENRSELFH
jgi:F0F1-type ATP synthase gamma subunit